MENRSILMIVYLQVLSAIFVFTAKHWMNQDVKSIYQIGVDRNKLLEDKENLSIGDTSNVITDLSLPTDGKNGSKITWKSDNTAAVGNDGKVTLGANTQTANLTATISLGNDYCYENICGNAAFRK